MCLESDHQRSICTIRVHNTAETPLKQHLTFVKVKWSRSVWLFVAPWTVAHHAPPSMEFSRQEYWSGLLFPTPGDLPDPGTEPASLASPVLAGGLFTCEARSLGRTGMEGSSFQQPWSVSWIIKAVEFIQIKATRTPELVRAWGRGLSYTVSVQS